MHVLGVRNIILMVTVAFLIGLAVLIYVRFSKDFAYDVENNLRSNEYYYPVVK